MFYLRSRPCHPIFVKLSSYIDWAARSACRISLFEVLLDKLVPLTVENDCQAFDFHYGAKKGQRRCEVGVKASFSVVCLKTDLREIKQILRIHTMISSFQDVLF